jgi:hypothetical protein
MNSHDLQRMNNHSYLKTNKMKTIKAFTHILLVVVGAALVIYGLNELGLINPIVEGVNFGIKKIKLLF